MVKGTEVRPASDADAVQQAIRLLRAGRLVAFPTDTVYGVGAHAFQSAAVEKLYTAKIRPRDKAIPLLLANADDLPLVAESVPPAARRLAARFWPGGLTLVVRKTAAVSDAVSAGRATVAVRVPDHPLPVALVAALGAPLATTSANLAGHPSPVTAQEVVRELGGRVALILDGGPCPGGVPSSVVDLTTSPPRLLREGAISRLALRRLLPDLE